MKCEKGHHKIIVSKIRKLFNVLVSYYLYIWQINPKQWRHTRTVAILPMKALRLFAYFVLTFITLIKYSAEITSKNGHVKIELYLIRGFRMRTVFQLSSVPQEVITPEKQEAVCWKLFTIEEECQYFQLRFGCSIQNIQDHKVCNLEMESSFTNLQFL